MTRTIWRDRAAEIADRQWVGRTVPATHDNPTVPIEREWRGPHVESVIRAMNKALGPMPECDYIVQES